MSELGVEVSGVTTWHLLELKSAAGFSKSLDEASDFRGVIPPLRNFSIDSSSARSEVLGFMRFDDLNLILQSYLSRDMREKSAGGTPSSFMIPLGDGRNKASRMRLRSSLLSAFSS